MLTSDLYVVFVLSNTGAFTATLFKTEAKFTKAPGRLRQFLQRERQCMERLAAGFSL